MTQKLFKYITPLRITGVWLSIWAIENYINTERLTEQGFEPGLGGLGFMVFGGLAFLTFALDLILSSILNQKWNWLAQIALVAIFVVATHIK